MFTKFKYPVCSVVVIALYFVSSIYCDKLKVCVVDGKGGFKKAAKYCPVLDAPDSQAECVTGIDRLDCLRKVSKGVADFSMFSSEDLITASNSKIEILVTNELRYKEEDKYEYEIVAVVTNESGITNRHNLKDKKLCHSGFGDSTESTKILSNYFESSVVPQSCSPQLSLPENRIKASSEFFSSSCKAGPWVENEREDYELKKKYPTLCSLCDNPSVCSTHDKYWGRSGSLLCLTDGAGDIVWSRLDDVKVHFGLVGGTRESSPDGYSLLCPDDTIRPLNTTTPCVWVVKPWSVIAAERTLAQDVQDLVKRLSHTTSEETSWQSALLNLLEAYYVESVKSLTEVVSIEDYLSKAKGFLSANSFTGCHPPRTIRICTTSIVENLKCAWLRESAAAYGIEPDLDCLKADNTTHCMKAVGKNFADVVVVPPDLVKTAVKQFNLETLFYETVNDNEKYITVAVTKNDSPFNKLEDLKGTKACFPVYDGIAWNSVAITLNSLKLTNWCPAESGLINFFEKICAPGTRLDKSLVHENCDVIKYRGEFGALRCLLDGAGDVSFVSKNSLEKFVQDVSNKPYFANNFSLKNLKILCENKLEPCHLSWSSIGQAMIRPNSSKIWIKDTLDVFLQLDSLFGKNYKTVTTAFTMFGPFNGKSNVLFHDATARLRNVPINRNIDKMSKEYNSLLKNEAICQSSAVKLTSGVNTLIFTSIILYFVKNHF